MIEMLWLAGYGFANIALFLLYLLAGLSAISIHERREREKKVRDWENLQEIAE